jgi:hypothetical protein
MGSRPIALGRLRSPEGAAGSHLMLPGDSLGMVPVGSPWCGAVTE